MTPRQEAYPCPGQDPRITRDSAEAIHSFDVVVRADGERPIIVAQFARQHASASRTVLRTPVSRPRPLLAILVVSSQAPRALAHEDPLLHLLAIPALMPAIRGLETPAQPPSGGMSSY